jgi:hypothetical protein
MRIEVDRASIGAYLGTPVESRGQRRKVVAFERFEVTPGNSRLVRDLLERETATFAGAPEKLAEPGAIGFGRRAFGSGRGAGTIGKNRGHCRSLFAPEAFW